MLRVATQLFSGSLVGKLAGVLREVLLASLFGTSGIVAAVRAAQAATLIPVNFFTADIISAGFLPLYSRYATTNAAKANALFWLVSLLLTTASVLVVTLLIVDAGFWVKLLVPGFGPQEQAYTSSFVRIFALGVPFYIAGSLFSYREMGHGAYILASARATLQSIGMILGTVAAFYLRVPNLLAWGFTGAYITYSIWGLERTIRRGGGSPIGQISGLDFKDVAREFWSVVSPLILLPLFLQGNIAAERAVASLLGITVAASLDYAKFITDTGVLLIAVPLGLASLSVISRMNDEDCQKLISRVLPSLLLVTIPISTAVAVHSHIIIALIYQRGAFGAASTQLTQTILWGFAIGFWAQVISYVLLKTLSARMRNGEVFKYMALALGANVAINFGFYKFLGPIVLGLGSCAYGIVLTGLTAHALGVLGVIVKRILMLSLGAAGYALLGTFLPQKGILAYLLAGALFTVYWLIFIVALPLMRVDAQRLLGRLRRSDA